MESELLFSKAKSQQDKKPSLGHKTCKNFTNLEIVKMLLQSPKEQNLLGRSESMVKYPCCGQKVFKSLIEQRRRGICLSCGKYPDQVQSLEQKVLLKDPKHKICRTCFDEKLRQLLEENIQPKSLQFYLNRLLYRCSHCFKVIGFQSELDQRGQQKESEDKKCKKCFMDFKAQEQLENDLSNQSSITSISSLKVSTNSNFSTRSFLSILMQSEIDQVKFTKSIYNKISANFPILQNTYLDRSLYENKEKKELIDIIEELKFQNKLLKKQLSIEQKRKVNQAKLSSETLNIQENTQGGTAKYQGGLNDSQKLNNSNISSQISESIQNITQSPFSKTKSEINFICNSIQSFQQTQVGNNSIKSNAESNSLIGTEKTVPSNQKIHLPTPSQNPDTDFDQVCETAGSNVQNVKKASKMTYSCVSGSICEKSAENSPVESKDFFHNRIKLVVTAPFCYRGCLAQEQELEGDPNFGKKNSNLN